MIKSTCLNEDKQLQKLPVIISPRLSEQIKEIYSLNHDNSESLSQFTEYLNGLKNYIANPVIAWDYTNKYQHNSKGETFLKELEYAVWFTIKTNKTSQTNYVYIFNIKFELEQFDLKDPGSISECYPSDIIPKEISKETLYRLMLEEYERYLYSLF